MDSRPREERDLSEFYDNLDDTTPLAVFVSKPSDFAPSPQLAQRENNLSLGSTSKSYTLNTALRDHKITFAEGSKVEKTNKFSKALISYGYRPSARPRVSGKQCYARFQQSLPSHPLSKYDMDEQDLLYLEWLNSRSETLKLSCEVFEIAMSVLEYEWHKLESRMIAMVGPGQDGRDDLKMDANFEKYGSDDGTGGVDSISEQRCAVCNDSECDNTNSIVYCDGCNIAVHQECYGVAFIPEGQWFCRRCMVNRGSSVSCAFCPSKTGAFKQLDNGMWSHVVCALWIREVYFANPVYLEPIEGVASIPRSRWTLVCYICKQKIGACIQCSARKCTQAYHVTCAKRAGLFMAMEKGVSGAVSSNDTLKSYCDRHAPSHMNKQMMLSGIHRTRMFYRDCHSLSRKNDRLASERKQANRVNRFKWRTENGTPIAPQLFADILVSTMKSLKIGDNGPDRVLRGLGTDTTIEKDKQDKQDNLKDISAALCRYWCLKREAKNGAPLVRMRNSEQEIATPEPVHHVHHTCGESTGPDHAENVDKTQMSEKIEFGHGLDKDLQKLIDLNSLAVERQKLISQQNVETFKMADTAYFAFQSTATEIMDKINQNQSNRDHKKEGLETVSSALEQVASDIADGKIWSASDVCQNIHRGSGERNNTSAVGHAAKALRYWSQTGVQELKNVEKSLSGGIPFTIIHGLDASLKKHDPKAVLESEDLSEVEDDPFVQFTNREILRKFVAG
ncbi:hypothetical protein JCM33374_g5744 [Metschnikowia sp. JCM 33374]|nr:hypothetical protein JCM33374_g5744 [Metschnikowia sp. JCM 33374]